MLKHTRSTRCNDYSSNDYKAYKSLAAQTKFKSFPNMSDTARPHATWKWKHVFRKMVIPGERKAEEGESEDTDDTDSVESYPEPASIGDIDITAPGIRGRQNCVLLASATLSACKLCHREKSYCVWAIKVVSQILIQTDK